MDEADINRNAKLLIDQFGSDAVRHAKRRAEAMALMGDSGGSRAWNWIAQVIAKMQSGGAAITLSPEGRSSPSDQTEKDWE